MFAGWISKTTEKYRINAGVVRRASFVPPDKIVYTYVISHEQGIRECTRAHFYHTEDVPYKLGRCPLLETVTVAKKIRKVSWEEGTHHPSKICAYIFAK